MNKVAKWQFTTGDNEHSRIVLKAIKRKKKQYNAALRVGTISLFRTGQGTVANSLMIHLLCCL